MTTKKVMAGVLAGSLLAMCGSDVAVAGAKFLYIANQNQAVRAYSINPTTGALSAVQGGPWIADEYPFSLAASPTGKFIYSVNLSSDDISEFGTNPTTGALAPVPGSPFAFPNGAVRMIVHPNGKLAYVNSIAYDVWPLLINTNTGALTAQGNVAQAGVSPTLEIDPKGRFLYAANGSTGIISDPPKTNNISAFTIDSATGALTEITGSPFRTGTGPRHLTVDPSSKYLVVSNTDSHDIRSYSINQTTGALTQVGSTLSTGGNNWDVRFEPSGHFVYTTIADKKRISIYSLNAGTGTLTKVADLSTSGNPNWIGVDPSGKFLFVLIYNSGATVASYSINSSTGALSLASGPFKVDEDTGVVGMVVTGTAQ